MIFKKQINERSFQSKKFMAKSEYDEFERMSDFGSADMGLCFGAFETD